MGLPVIVESNAWTLPQERFNAQWVREQNLGLVLPNFRGVSKPVQYLLSGSQLREMQNRILQINNRALYEIPPILEAILYGRAKAAPAELSPQN
jgi:1,2-diacylglycerol 3-beta-galactosyltransferase